MSYEFKPEYYQANIKKREEIQSELFVSNSVGDMGDALIDIEFKSKWEKLCLEQQSFLPEVKQQMPKEWKRKTVEEDSRTINFLDCSRELLEKEA